MPFLYNSEVLKEYSHFFAKNICEKTYSTHTVVNGFQILELTPVLQVNLFIIKDLHEKWQSFVKALDSPYFDFENENIAHAKQQFIISLSQHIAVKQADFEPLLEKATYDTLSLLIDPQSFFEREYGNTPNQIVDAAILEELQKYLRFNDFVPELMLQQLGEATECSSSQANIWTEEILTQNLNELASLKDWEEAFSAIEPLENYPIFKTKSQQIEDSINQNINVEQNQSFFDAIGQISGRRHYQSKPIVPQETYVAPLAEEKHEEKELEPIIFEKETEPEHVVEPVVQNEEIKAVEPVDEKKEENENIVTKNPEPTPKGAILNFVDHIPLHQKFLFIFSLFLGKTSDYELFISQLESADSSFEANQIIAEWHEKNSWEKHLDVVADLNELVARRFLN